MIDEFYIDEKHKYIFILTNRYTNILLFDLKTCIDTISNRFVN